jgi:Ni/Co efflux regulator RcnB
MKTRAIASLLAATMLMSPLTGFAQQQQGEHHEEHGGAQGHGPEQHAAPPAHASEHAAPQQHAAPQHAAAPHQHGGGHQGHGRPQHAGGPPVPHRDWHQGSRLPSSYRGNQYVVDDWRGHHLHEPPRGYHWVNVNGEYVLVAIASGVIASILFGAAYQQ